MHIALLGGSFDPPHNGHIAVAQAVFEAIKPDRVELLVSFESPHADGKSNQANAQQRLKMTGLAADEHDWLGVEDIEHRMAGKSFTHRTVTELLVQHPSNRYSFVIGGDMLSNLRHWYRIEELLTMIDFVPVYRQGFDERVYQDLSRHLPQDAVVAIYDRHVEMTPVDISSTEVRATTGIERAKLVPGNVAEFIEAEGLYR
ncbi:MAG: nicotinate (nicotinamide) nucleotide adenylyltransferase [Planctomycetota bacterium]